MMPALTPQLPADFRAESLNRWPRLTDFCREIYGHITPHELALFEPRHIVAPGGYQSPRTVASLLYTVLGENALKLAADDFLAPLQVTIQSICYEILNYSVPTYYVTEDFIRAVAATDMPGDMRGTELQWPMPAFVIGFPERFMREYIGLDVCYVFAANHDAGDHFCKHLPWAPGITTPEDKMSWTWFSYTNGMMESFVSGYWRNHYLSQTLTDYTYTDYTGATDTVVSRNKSATDLVSVLMLKLLAVLSMRSGMVKEGACTRPATVKKGQPRAALWTPNMIGADYRILRSPSTTAGTHASPKMHFRRRHSTWQVTAKKGETIVPSVSLPRNDLGYIQWDSITPETREQFLKTHKRIWIDPILVNAPD